MRSPAHHAPMQSARAAAGTWSTFMRWRPAAWLASRLRAESAARRPKTATGTVSGIWRLINAGMAAARHVGIRALLVHALDEQAKAFYLERGFIESPIEPMTLMLSLAQTAA